MKIAETCENFPDDDHDKPLLQDAIFRSLHESADAPSLRELHDDPYARAIQVTTIVLCNVGRVAELCQQCNLALDGLHVVVSGVEVDDLECDDVPRWDVDALVDGAVCTLSNYYSIAWVGEWDSLLSFSHFSQEKKRKKKKTS